MKLNNRYLIETPNGFKNFKGAIRTEGSGFEIIFKSGNKIKCSETHKIKVAKNIFRQAKKLKKGDKVFRDSIVNILKITGNFIDPFDVEGHEYLQNGIVHHNCHYLVFDESAWVESSTFNDVVDSLLPSQSGLSTKKVIFISTPNGKNHFYDIWKRAGFTSADSKNGYIKYFGDWKTVPRFKSDGSKYESQEFKKEIIKKYGERYFAVNYACEFQGSANTLISGEILDSFVICDALYTRKPNIAIFEDPIPNTKYVMGVDSAKSGGDFCAFQVLKIENTGFTQVARCKCQIDYLKFVDYIVDYGKSYNNAMLIVENNDGSGQSIADFIKSGYDYANLYHDVNKINGKRFKYPGFRTTYKTRYALLQNMKMFAESNKLKIVDSDTIKELFDFVEINGKYQAESGKHDDLVMSLAICFAIFLNAKNLDNIQEIIKSINTETEFKNDFIKDKYLSIDYSKDIIKQLKEIKDSETALGFGADF